MEILSNVFLEIMAALAVVFSNMACRGKCYEPILPSDLQEDDEM